MRGGGVDKLPKAVGALHQVFSYIWRPWPLAQGGAPFMKNYWYYDNFTNSFGKLVAPPPPPCARLCLDPYFFYGSGSRSQNLWPNWIRILNTDINYKPLIIHRGIIGLYILQLIPPRGEGKIFKILKKWTGIIIQILKKFRN